MSDEKPNDSQALLRLALEMGPLVVFFVGNAKFGIFKATGVFMVAIVLSLGGSWLLERRLPVMPVVTAVFVLVFGGLTLALGDETFIKLKPTIVNVLFALILGAGLAMKRLFLKVAFGQAFRMTDDGWRGLTVRFAVLFCALALLNEIVWRNFSTDTWVAFKVWGILPLTVVFIGFQMPFINKHELGEAAD